MSSTAEVWRKIVYTIMQRSLDMSQRPWKASVVWIKMCISPRNWLTLQSSNYYTLCWLAASIANWVVKHETRTQNLVAACCKLFTEFNDLKQKFCYIFSSVFEFLSILLFFLYELEAAIAPSALPPIETASGQPDIARRSLQGRSI